MRTYVIIGTGAAGLSAAETIREKDPSANLTVIGDDPHGFYSRPGIAYYLTGESSERQLVLKQGAPFRYIKSKAVDLRPEPHQVITADGRCYSYDRLLLATGSAASKINNPGFDLKGVVKLDTLEDAKEIVKLSGKRKAAVVIGGGIIALEIVEGLVALGMEVHYFLRGDHYWSNVLDEAESCVVEKHLKEHGIQIHLQTQLGKIEGKNGKVAGVETEAGEKIKCHMVAVAIGVQPCMEIAKAAGLKVDRGIVTDDCLQTSAPDIYAAGDVAQVLDPATGRSTLDTLWGIALAHGRAAACNMIGERTQYRKKVPFNVCRLAGLTTSIIGSVGQAKKDEDLLSISRGDSETWRQLPNVMAIQCDHEVNRCRIMAGPTNLVGAVLMGDQTLSRPLHELIANRVDIASIRSELSHQDIPVADTIIDFWVKWSQSSESLRR